MPQLEAIERTKKGARKTTVRWMPGVNRQRMTAAFRTAGSIGAAFLLCFADMMGIPSGLHGAWMCALAACGESLLWPCCGVALSVGMRLVWGLAPRWETLLTLLIVLPAPRFLWQKKPWRITAWTALSLLPVLMAAWGGTTERRILACGTLLTGMLAAPVMCRGLRVMRGGGAIVSLEERVAVVYTGALILMGGGCMAFLGVNVGVLGAGMAALCAAVYLGPGAGCITGLVSGLVLAVTGLPLTLGVSLAMGGFLGGVVQLREKRWLTCAGFLCAGLMTLMLSGLRGGGAASGLAAAALLTAFLPMEAERALQGFFGRFGIEKSDADACCAQLLARWEHTVQDMVRSVPMPPEQDVTTLTDGWKEHLCAGCPDEEHCSIMAEEASVQRAQEVARAFLQPEDRWLPALEGLRGLGCGRLYHLREGMERMRQEAKRERRQWQKSLWERELLVTHLGAMAGAARRFALMATGGTWWDAANARSLRQAAAERAVPATLLYARRVEGHAQAAWEMHRPDDALARELTTLTAAVLAMPMEEAFREGDRLFLGERPLLKAETGAAGTSLVEEENGDAWRIAMLPGGMLLTVLADGMGHGQRARRESSQTVAMMHLCMEAGYTRQQALTAVNGMMLCASPGETFATVDMVTIDLWSGRCTLDKLGAAASWLVRGDTLTPLRGEALPLGILERVESRSLALRLREGDWLLLLTDGVEDAFESEAALETALRTALLEESPQEVADRLLTLAALSRGGRADDRSAVVIRLARSGG